MAACNARVVAMEAMCACGPLLVLLALPEHAPKVANWATTGLRSPRARAGPRNRSRRRRPRHRPAPPRAQGARAVQSAPAPKRSLTRDAGADPTAVEVLECATTRASSRVTLFGRWHRRRRSGMRFAHLGPVRVAQQLRDHARKRREQVALARRARQVGLARRVDLCHAQRELAQLGMCRCAWRSAPQHTCLAARPPREANEAGAVVVRRGRVRRRKGVAVELGVDAHGADLVDDRELAYVHVHVGLDRQLPRRLEDGHARLHRAAAACADNSWRGALAQEMEWQDC